MVRRSIWIIGAFSSESRSNRAVHGAHTAATCTPASVRIVTRCVASREHLGSAAPLGNKWFLMHFAMEWCSLPCRGTGLQWGDAPTAPHLPGTVGAFRSPPVLQGRPPLAVRSHRAQPARRAARGRYAAVRADPCASDRIRTGDLRTPSPRRDPASAVPWSTGPPRLPAEPGMLQIVGDRAVLRARQDGAFLNHARRHPVTGRLSGHNRATCVRALSGIEPASPPATGRRLLSAFSASLPKHSSERESIPAPLPSPKGCARRLGGQAESSHAP